MQRKQASLRKSVTIHVCLVCCLLLAALPASAGLWWQWRDRLLAAYAENELVAASGEDAAASLKLLLTLRQPGMAAVVRALGAPKAETRELAHRVLDDELNRCDAGPPSETTAKWLSDLASALTENIDGLPPAARHRAGNLAMRVLSLSETSPAADRGRLIDSCHGVLNAIETELPSPRSHSTPLSMAPRQRRRRSEILLHAPSVRHADTSTELELAQLAAPALMRADAPGRMAHAEPRTLMTNDTTALVAKGEAASKPARGNQVTVAGYTREIDHGQAEDDARQVARQKARELDVIELFTQLNEPNPIAAAARAELDSRGFSPRQIEVSQHLVSHDAAERLRWAEWLPGIRGIDARFWLLRLSHDPNLQVRRAAVGLLATDRDPEVVRRLQQIVVVETDDRIRDLASRALEPFDER